MYIDLHVPMSQSMRVVPYSERPPFLFNSEQLELWIFSMMSQKGCVKIPFFSPTVISCGAAGCTRNLGKDNTFFHLLLQNLLWGFVKILLFWLQDLKSWNIVNILTCRSANAEATSHTETQEESRLRKTLWGHLVKMTIMLLQTTLRIAAFKRVCWCLLWIKGKLSRCHCCNCIWTPWRWLNESVQERETCKGQIISLPSPQTYRGRQRTTEWRWTTSLNTVTNVVVGFILFFVFN